MNRFLLSVDIYLIYSWVWGIILSQLQQPQLSSQLDPVLNNPGLTWGFWRELSLDGGQKGADLHLQALWLWSPETKHHSERRKWSLAAAHRRSPATRSHKHTHTHTDIHTYTHIADTIRVSIIFRCRQSVTHMVMYQHIILSGSPKAENTHTHKHTNILPNYSFHHQYPQAIMVSRQQNESLFNIDNIVNLDLTPLSIWPVCDRHPQ